jgi:hypothetical protein
MTAAPPTLADFAAAIPLADVDALARSGRRGTRGTGGDTNLDTLL